MPFCPTCHTEYETQVEICEICKSALVDSLSRTSKEDDPEAIGLVELATFPSVSEAEMIREILEKNGLRTIQRGETDPIGVASGAEHVTLLVEQQDLARATELYEAYFSGNDVEDFPPDQE